MHLTISTVHSAEIYNGNLNVIAFLVTRMQIVLESKCHIHWYWKLRLCCVFSLKKNYQERPNYVQLLEHPFIVENENKEVDVSSFVTEALDNYGTKPTSA